MYPPSWLPIFSSPSSHRMSSSPPPQRYAHPLDPTAPHGTFSNPYPASGPPPGSFHNPVPAEHSQAKRPPQPKSEDEVSDIELSDDGMSLQVHKPWCNKRRNSSSRASMSGALLADGLQGLSLEGNRKQDAARMKAAVAHKSEGSTKEPRGRSRRRRVSFSEDVETYQQQPLDAQTVHDCLVDDGDDDDDIYTGVSDHHQISTCRRSRSRSRSIGNSNSHGNGDNRSRLCRPCLPCSGCDGAVDLVSTAVSLHFHCCVTSPICSTFSWCQRSLSFASHYLYKVLSLPSCTNITVRLQLNHILLLHHE